MFKPFKLLNKLVFGGAFLILIALGSACEQAPSMKANNAVTPLPTAENTEKLTSVERELRDMETANFKVIYVFKRKDGGVFDKEDKKYLAENKPADANRFILTDDEKAFVAGSNYPFSLDNLAALEKRFVVEDYSKPGAPTPVNNNTGNRKPGLAVNNNTNQTPKNVKKGLPQ
jgi:hypothetical protein